MENVSNAKIGCIGCGIMGGSVIKAIASKYNPSNIFISTKHPEKAQDFAAKTGVNALKSNLEVAKAADYIFIAVKPAYVKEVLIEIKEAFTTKKTIISMAAGLNLDKLTAFIQPPDLSAPSTDLTFVMPSLVRIMPNLPAMVGEAMTAICHTSEIEEQDLSVVKTLLESCGKAEIVPEKLMDGVTAVSGSGPAYAFMFIEALADAAVRFGMPRAQAYTYAAQTLKGAAAMALEDQRSPSQLKDAVCSPGGTTIEGVISLERHGFRGTVIEAATAAYNKSVDMGRK